MSKPFIATRNIFFGTALGYAPGDEVDPDVVEAHGLEDSVAREGTKAAEVAGPPPNATSVAEQMPKPK